MVLIDIIKDSPVDITERGFALMIDLVITIGFSILMHFLFDFHPLFVAIIFSYLYDVFLPLFWNGYTVGKRILGIRIACLTGEKLTLGTMIIRGFLAQLLYSITAGILLIASIYLVATRTDRRSIHDLLARTYVTSNIPE
ncbi:RDD family protein [Ornithinibacillus massiliensis]|uniref:RDD family protein n=1 Tax=Ornithinibacillus massiliensis TaxID=1944633 RepID=A0ABS5MC04_9BACI|nr:RDD family protein [Ornithinibacillus massiliensis]MBS3679854.1 RDD family protein [Ornithinibacillus massiliensis]